MQNVFQNTVPCNTLFSVRFYTNHTFTNIVCAIYLFASRVFTTFIRFSCYKKFQTFCRTLQKVQFPKSRTVHFFHTVIFKIRLLPIRLFATHVFWYKFWKSTIFGGVACTMLPRNNTLSHKNTTKVLFSLSTLVKGRFEYFHSYVIFSVNNELLVVTI